MPDVHDTHYTAAHPLYGCAPTYGCARTIRLREALYGLWEWTGAGSTGVGRKSASKGLWRAGKAYAHERILGRLETTARFHQDQPPQRARDGDLMRAFWRAHCAR